VACENHVISACQKERVRVMQVNGIGGRLQDSFWPTSTEQFGVVICVIAQLAALNRVEE
jgi:hypothetical protein